MAITVTATVRCDMCGREEAVVLRENSRHGKVDAALMDVARMVPHWDMLGRDGYASHNLDYQVCGSTALTAVGSMLLKKRDDAAE